MKLAAFSPRKAYNAVKMEAEKYEDNILVEARDVMVWGNVSSIKFQPY